MALTNLIATMPGITSETPDADVLAWLQEPVPVVGAINSRTLLRWAAAGARLDRLSGASNGHENAGVRSLAAAALLVVQRPDTELDMGDAGHVALVDALVAGGVLTVEEKAELVALATVQLPRHVAAGYQRVGLGDVANARAV